MSTFDYNEIAAERMQQAVYEMTRWLVSKGVSTDDEVYETIRAGLDVFAQRFQMHGEQQVLAVARRHRHTVASLAPRRRE